MFNIAGWEASGLSIKGLAEAAGVDFSTTFSSLFLRLLFRVPVSVWSQINKH